MAQRRTLKRPCPLPTYLAKLVHLCYYHLRQLPLTPPRSLSKSHDTCRENPLTRSRQSRCQKNLSTGKTAENGRVWHTKQLFSRRKPQFRNRTQSGNLPNHANLIIKLITVQTTPHPVYPVHPCKSKKQEPSPMSLSQLRSEVNSIKRKLVRELRVVRARRVAEDYCGLWKDLVARKKLPPDPLRLIRKPLQAHQATRRFRCRRRLSEPVPRAAPPAPPRCNPPPPPAQGSRHGPHILLDPRPGRILNNRPWPSLPAAPGPFQSANPAHHD